MSIRRLCEASVSEVITSIGSGAELLDGQFALDLSAEAVVSLAARRLESGVHDQQWLCLTCSGDGEAEAVLCARELEWDSTHYDVKTERIELLAGGDLRSLTRLVGEYLGGARRRGVDYVNVRLSANADTACRAATAAGLSLVAEKIMYRLGDLSGYLPDPRVSQAVDTAVVETVAELVATSIVHGRFRSEAAFDPELVDDMYRAWAMGLATGESGKLLVLEGSASEPLGAVCVGDGRSAYGLEVIDRVEPGFILLVAVDPAVRGKGLGAALLSTALNGMRESGQKVAYANVDRGNEASRALFESVGFGSFSEMKEYSVWLRM